MRIGRYTLTYELETTGNCDVCVSSIRGFKGLERNVVILTELDNMPYALKDRADLSLNPADTSEFVNHLLYIGISRAKNHLIVLGNLPDPFAVTH